MYFRIYFKIRKCLDKSNLRVSFRLTCSLVLGRGTRMGLPCGQRWVLGQVLQLGGQEARSACLAPVFVLCCCVTKSQKCDGSEPHGPRPGVPVGQEAGQARRGPARAVQAAGRFAGLRAHVVVGRTPFLEDAKPGQLARQGQRRASLPPRSVLRDARTLGEGCAGFGQAHRRWRPF